MKALSDGDQKTLSSDKIKQFVLKVRWWVGDARSCFTAGLSCRSCDMQSAYGLMQNKLPVVPIKRRLPSKMDPVCRRPYISSVNTYLMAP